MYLQNFDFMFLFYYVTISVLIKKDVWFIMWLKAIPKADLNMNIISVVEIIVLLQS